MFKTIVGDATKPADLGNTPIVIPHVCNDVGGWGAGFVLALSRAFGPGPEQAYRAWFKNDASYGSLKPQAIKVSGDGRFDLGNVQFVKIESLRLVVANMVAQHGVGPGEDGRPPIRYAALAKAMTDVADFCLMAKGAEIHCPKFGSDLAGGDWKVISELIQEIWTDNGIPVFVYEFQPRR